MAQKESIFNPKKFGLDGPFSDDILMIGINAKGDQLEVAYYPIEVKMGNNDSSVINKAKKQVRSASKYLNSELFREDSFYAKLLRNQLMQLAITQVKKIIMYNMWAEKDWTSLMNSEIMAKLIDDDYTLVDHFNDSIHDCGMITFTKNAITRRKQGVKHIDIVIDHFEHPIQDAFKYLSKGLAEICEENKWTYIKEKDDILIAADQDPEHPYQITKITKEKIETKSIDIKALNDHEVKQEKAIAKPEQREMQIVFGTDQIADKEVIYNCFLK
jgi:DNA phosphorothioation-dependent restriction protein DptH